MQAQKYEHSTSNNSNNERQHTREYIDTQTAD